MQQASEGTERCSLLAAYVQNLADNPPAAGAGAGAAEGRGRNGSLVRGSAAASSSAAAALPDSAIAAADIEVNVADVAADQREPLYLHLMKYWAYTLSSFTVADPLPFHIAVLKQSWLWLELCQKSMALELLHAQRMTAGTAATGTAAIGTAAIGTAKHHSRFAARHEEFCANLVELLDVFGQMIAQHSKVGIVYLKRLNVSLALFFVDCFALLRRAAVFELIECYLDALDVRDAVQLEMRLTFLQLLRHAEYFQFLFFQVNM